jgi:hypothetical protein
MQTSTGIRCRVQIKDEWIPIWKQLLENNITWNRLNCNSLKVKHYVSEWSKEARSNLIPFGLVTCYRWIEDSANWQRKVDGNTIQFQCSLKDYDNEINKFIEIILSNMVCSIDHLEVMREGDEQSIIYELIYGEIKQKGIKSIDIYDLLFKDKIDS